MVKKTDTSTHKQKATDELDSNMLHYGKCAYRTTHKGSLNRHKLICKKYIYIYIFKVVAAGERSATPS